jgi:MFS family permease
MKDTLAPLRYSAFRYVALGRLVAMFGNAIAPIALAFAVLDLTGSAGDLGLVVGTRSLVNVVFLLFGGVVADRLPRQLVVVVSCLLSFATQGAIAALVLTGHATIPRLIALGAVNGLTAAFFFPATSAVIAQTVPGEIRKQANALNRLGINASMIIGASIGGLIVARFGSGWGLAIDSLTFALAAGLFALVRVPTYRNVDAARSSTLHELRLGWSEFTGRTWVWVVVLAACFFNLAEVGAVSVLGPTVADASFGRQSWGFILAAQTAGMLAGALVAIRLRARRLLAIGAVGCALPAMLLAMLAFGTSVSTLIAAAFVAGIGLEQFGIAWETSVQEHIPPEKLARVYSYDALGSFIAIPIGQVAAGPLAVAVGIQRALLMAAGIVVLATLAMLASRSVRWLEHVPAQPQPQTAAA